MSTKIETISKSGKFEQDLDIEEYSGGPKGKCLQLTQGLGKDIDEPGYIQLTQKDASLLIIALDKWLRDKYYERTINAK